jgi:glyoxylase-like metal-dependent hydrolase (beta-lactamase superfamily II)
MTEPTAVAQSVEVLDEDLGLSYWWVEDERLGGHVSTAYALRADEGTVLIDPLPLAPDAFASLGDVTAIVLSSGPHQRSAWRLRSELEVPVWAPALAQELDEEPDERYGHSAVLPGELVAFHTPGPGTTQHTLILDDYVGFVPDLVLTTADGGIRLTPDEWLRDPRQARISVRLLLEQSIDVLCPSHGPPVTDDVQAKLQAALDEAGEADDPDYVEVPPEE